MIKASRQPTPYSTCRHPIKMCAIRSHRDTAVAETMHRHHASRSPLATSIARRHCDGAPGRIPPSSACVPRVHPSQRNNARSAGRERVSCLLSGIHVQFLFKSGEEIIHRFEGRGLRRGQHMKTQAFPVPACRDNEDMKTVTTHRGAMHGNSGVASKRGHGFRSSRPRCRGQWRSARRLPAGTLGPTTYSLMAVFHGVHCFHGRNTTYSQIPG
jgi:hypothetical protein